MSKISPFHLENKTIFITGASSGIGRQCAISCSNMGARIILLGRNKERLDQTLKELKTDKNHLKFLGDITNNDEIDEVLKEIKSVCKNIDGVIHAAGISSTLPFRRVTKEKMEEYFDTNVSSSINITRELVSGKMISSESSLVFITSVMATVGDAGKVLYGMTKGAVLAGVKSLSVELARKKIRVNCLSPGVVNSPLNDNAVYRRDNEAMKNIIEMHPLGLGDPSDVANACVFLLSDASKWITGTNLVVDGGYTAK